MVHLIKSKHIRLSAIGTLLLFSALACSFDLGSLVGGSSSPDETELAQNVEATLTAVIATENSSFTETASVASATPTPTKTLAPTATRPPTQTKTPTKAYTPTPEGVFISEIVFASKVDENDLPVNGAKSFKKGITKLYGTFTYSGMKDGAKVTFRWDNNGKEFVSMNRVWSSGPSGNHWVSAYYTETKGLPSGTWTLYIHVDGELVQTGTCTIYQ